MQMQCNIMLCHAMLCYVMLWYVMVCYGMLCYVMLWYVMVCYGMLWYVMVCMYLFKYLFIYLFITFGISCRMANTNVCNVLELSWIILSIFACSWAHLLGRQCKLISVDVTFLVIKPHWVWPLYHGNGKKHGQNTVVNCRGRQSQCWYGTWNGVM